MLFFLVYVFWLISPGNPLKSMAPAPIQIRLEQAQKRASGSGRDVGDYFASIGAAAEKEKIRLNA